MPIEVLSTAEKIDILRLHAAFKINKNLASEKYLELSCAEINIFLSQMKSA